MQLAVLHLSDIHLREPEHTNSVLSKFNKIVPAIKSELIGVEHLFVVVSGDIAFSGKENEYLMAIDAFETLSDSATSELGLKPQFIMIPGNHDCHFVSDSRVRRIVLEGIRNGTHEIDESIIDQCCVLQEEYRSFATAYESRENLIFQDKLFASSLFYRGQFRIVFHQLNTAWTSELHENPGNMVLPIERYEDVISRNTGDLIITILHHPFNWFIPENGRKIRRVLERYSDVILTGHEHVTTISKQDNLHGQHVEHIEGGALQDSGDPDVSEFNLLRFNLKEGTQRVFQFHWDKTMYVIKSSTEWIKFKRSEWLSTKVFQIHEDFQAYLNDPGVTLYHPRKTKLTLDDTFVYPDAKIINRTDVTDNLERFVSLENVFATLNTENKYMIIGEEKSGKTTVCKILYKNFYDRGYVPVLIDGSKVNSHVLEDFDKLVTQTFMEQYRAEKVEQFRQLSNEKKVILVDNLDRCKLNNRFTYKLVSQLGKLYRHIVLTGSSLFQFMELMTGDDDGDVDVAYQKFELVEFGHKLRYDLVNKWNKLGREYTIEDDELLKENDRVNAILDTIIGYNFVPSYPFFLLVLIQTIESGVQHNLKESSYGYYYDFLITREFMNINLRHEEIDAFYNYVTELAFKFYTKKAKEISEEEFREFNVWFGKEYELSYDLGFMVSRLEAASIIEKFRSSYRFRYPYIYYYFVARYLANNISDDQIKARISFMCEKVHIKEYANILMFLTHMSKDPFILSEIVAKARAIFADVVPTKLENDVASINALVDTLPKLVYETVDVQKHREQRLIARDELERANAETAVELEEDEYEELDIIARLNSAFKSLEILGQILKNYYGSIKADDKYQLCKEAYDLGLRSLNSFLSVLGNNLDGMVSEVHKILEKRRLSSGQSIDRDRIDRISRRFVFNLTLLISYTFIRKISTSIGTKNLMETFRRIVSEDSSVAVRLVDISLRLDYLQFIPFPELEEFIEVARGNALGNTLAKALVLNHMYMFNVSYKDKQRVSDLLDIPIRQQRSIDLLSHRKKS